MRLLSKEFAFASHRRIVGVGAHLQSLVLLALRVTWGWQLLAAGYGHLTHIDKTVEAFKGWGIPFPLANVYISGTTEMIGGALLVSGLAARLIAVPLVFNFLVAYATASRLTIVQLITGEGGTRLDAYDSFINDSAFPMLILALAMLAFGPGKLSLDYLLRRFVFSHHSEKHSERFDMPHTGEQSFALHWPVASEHGRSGIRFSSDSMPHSHM
jgi:putative oxidoreductase